MRCSSETLTIRSSTQGVLQPEGRRTRQSVSRQSVSPPLFYVQSAASEQQSVVGEAARDDEAGKILAYVGHSSTHSLTAARVDSRLSPKGGNLTREKRSRTD